ncbi:MAG: hypothetical protein U1F11_04850 [Steroidobacteraceae bacterium]
MRFNTTMRRGLLMLAGSAGLLTGGAPAALAQERSARAVSASRRSW